MNSLPYVKEYHEKMGITISHDISISNPSRNRYRIERIGDELFKFNHALEAEDKPSALEYLVNLQMELDSTVLILGMEKYMERASELVHQANMTKLDNNGNPVIMDGGIIAEGKNYIAPHIAGLITQIQRAKE